ncbi:hypothetical protein AVEN_196085-1 [Araneus ventricosus]|uniref:Uncharacterized protein n=1 Tax=Araneus ventricosus TaxID=182803 RepID=A0A4Y2UV38_ARAVE|nr:hypothetical protein AVEN_196085-1 [Araneus ventricosus]
MEWSLLRSSTVVTFKERQFSFPRGNTTQRSVRLDDPNEKELQSTSHPQGHESGQLKVIKICTLKWRETLRSMEGRVGVSSIWVTRMSTVLSLTRMSTVLSLTRMSTNCCVTRMSTN